MLLCYLWIAFYVYLLSFYTPKQEIFVKIKDKV